jgi:DNA-binding transcriptional LysR family regulator
VIVPLIRRLATIAPAIGLELMLPSEESMSRLDEGLIDLIITPDGYVAPDHPAELLFEEQHVVVGWSGNPLLKKALTIEQFLEAGHIAVSVGANRTPAFIDRHLESIGSARKIDIRAPSFATVPSLLEGTTRLSVMHERLAHALQRHFAIAIQPLPIPAPPLRQMIQYHRARGLDEGLLWLRQQIVHEVSIPVIA